MKSRYKRLEASSEDKYVLRRLWLHKARSNLHIPLKFLSPFLFYFICSVLIILKQVKRGREKTNWSKKYKTQGKKMLVGKEEIRRKRKNKIGII